MSILNKHMSTLKRHMFTFTNWVSTVSIDTMRIKYIIRNRRSKNQHNLFQAPFISIKASKDKTYGNSRSIKC